MPDLQRETLLALLEDDLPSDARSLIVARLATSGLIGAKIRAALARQSCDGRIRGSLVYHKAHTGRWAGRGFQPQNLPKGVDLDGDILERALLATIERKVDRLFDLATELATTTHAILASLVRACIVAPFGMQLAVADYRSIEPRALLWLAGDHESLAAYRDDADVYAMRAAGLFNIPMDDVDEAARALGKSLEIGCGYQMGPARFESYAQTFGVDWGRVPLTPKEAVEHWRATHPAVAGYIGLIDGRLGRGGGYWRLMEHAAIQACEGQASSVGRVHWYRDGGDVMCLLPSGRPLIYRDARLETYRTSWGRESQQLTYDHSGQRRATYGGKLTENIVQAVCRDLLAATLVRLERAAIRVVLHVHDEVVAEITDAVQLDQMRCLMCEAPSWAAGLPLHVRAFASKRYRK